MKEATHKWVENRWFHSYKVQEQSIVINGDRIQIEVLKYEGA